MDAFQSLDSRRRNLRIVLFVIILATLPFYCAGFLLWGTAPRGAAGLTGTPNGSTTPIGLTLTAVTRTVQPSITPFGTGTSASPLQPTPGQFNPPAATRFLSPTPPIFVPPTSTLAPTLTQRPPDTQAPPPTNPPPPTAVPPTNAPPPTAVPPTNTEVFIPPPSNTPDSGPPPADPIDPNVPPADEVIPPGDGSSGGDLNQGGDTDNLATDEAF